MDLQNLIEELEEIVENATKVPLSSKCMIDREEVWEVIQQFRLNYPEEIKQAQWVKKERERILNESRQEASNIIETANRKVVMMVDETEIIKIAKAKAEEIVSAADMQAAEITGQAESDAKQIMGAANEKAEEYKRNARSYADSLLATAESTAGTAKDTIYTAHIHLSNSYRDAEDLMEKIHSARQIIGSRTE
jgi:cell division septum initiation protein DivIVA